MTSLSSVGYQNSISLLNYTFGSSSESNTGSTSFDSSLFNAANSYDSLGALSAQSDTYINQALSALQTGQTTVPPPTDNQSVNTNKQRNLSTGSTTGLAYQTIQDMVNSDLLNTQNTSGTLLSLPASLYNSLGQVDSTNNPWAATGTLIDIQA